MEATRRRGGGGFGKNAAAWFETRERRRGKRASFIVFEAKGKVYPDVIGSESGAKKWDA